MREGLWVASGCHGYTNVVFGVTKRSFVAIKCVSYSVAFYSSLDVARQKAQLHKSVQRVLFFGKARTIQALRDGEEQRHRKVDPACDVKT